MKIEQSTCSKLIANGASGSRTNNGSRRILGRYWWKLTMLPCQMLEIFSFDCMMQALQFSTRKLTFRMAVAVLSMDLSSCQKTFSSMVVYMDLKRGSDKINCHMTNLLASNRIFNMARLRLFVFVTMHLNGPTADSLEEIESGLLLKYILVPRTKGNIQRR